MSVAEPNSLALTDQSDAICSNNRSKEKNHHIPSNGNTINNTNNNNNIINNGRSSNPSLNTSTTASAGAGASLVNSTYSENHNAAYNNQILPFSISNHVFDTTIRKSPEGKDNDIYLTETDKNMASAATSTDSATTTTATTTSISSTTTSGINSGVPAINHNNNSTSTGHKKFGNDISTEIFSASNDNGKINVQVTVLVGKCFEKRKTFSLYGLVIYIYIRNTLQSSLSIAIISTLMIRIEYLLELVINWAESFNWIDIEKNPRRNYEFCNCSNNG